MTGKNEQQPTKPFDAAPVHLFDTYNSVLETELKELGYRFFYIPQTSTTMTLARELGPHKTVVVTDHQTEGRGRDGRSWLDEENASILMTIVEPFDDTKGDPQPFSGLSSHMFSLAVCLALQEITGNTDIKIRWPGDMFCKGKKLGGILIDNPDYSPSATYGKLFGLGINVHYSNADQAFPDTEYGAISLYQATGQHIKRQDLILAIVRKWSMMRVDTRVIQNNKRVFDYYNNLWQKNSGLLNQNIRITDTKKNETIEGIVLDSSIGNGIILQTTDGKIKEIVDYDKHTRIDLLTNN